MVQDIEVDGSVDDVGMEEMVQRCTHEVAAVESHDGTEEGQGNDDGMEEVEGDVVAMASPHTGRWIHDWRFLFLMRWRMTMAEPMVRKNSGAGWLTTMHMAS